LSIPYQAPDFSKYLNVSRTGNDLDRQIRKEIYDHYSETYDFIAARFGKPEISRLWRNYRAFSADYSDGQNPSTGCMDKHPAV